MKKQKIMPGTKAALLVVLAVSIAQFVPCKVWADETLTIAVAANFYRPMQEIVSAYEKRSGSRVRLVSGSTGKLYAQIIEGAPFDIFFAADRRRPVKLERKGLILPGSRFTYATGKLVVYTARHDIALAGRGLSILLDPGVRRVAIANPKTAPYGRAAMQALKSSGIYQKIKPKLVYGENIGQTFLFVRSQNADLGLVAASSVYHADGKAVPVLAAYDPIVQQAVTLRGALPASARFIAFFAISAVHDVIRKYGYGLPQ